ncbi:MAG: hemolysin III family protein [Acidobacteriota bacterium]
MYAGEKLNSITHLVGTVFALLGMGALISVSIDIGRPKVIVGFCVFGFSLVLAYTMSTLYHSFKPSKVKQLFRLFDHISIYLLIAGTYTPITLISMSERGGWKLLLAVWILAVIGVLSEVFLTGKAVKVLQLSIYLAMGWLCVIDFASVRASLPGAGFVWLLAGGVTYTTGVCFYLLDKIKRPTSTYLVRHAHGIWHFFVMAGSVAHFIAIIGYVR